MIKGLCDSVASNKYNKKKLTECRALPDVIQKKCSPFKVGLAENVDCDDFVCKKL